MRSAAQGTAWLRLHAHAGGSCVAPTSGCAVLAAASVSTVMPAAPAPATERDCAAITTTSNSSNGQRLSEEEKRRGWSRRLRGPSWWTAAAAAAAAPDAGWVDGGVGCGPLLVVVGGSDFVVSIMLLGLEPGSRVPLEGCAYVIRGGKKVEGGRKKESAKFSTCRQPVRVVSKWCLSFSASQSLWNTS